MLSAAVWLLCNSLFFSLRLAGNPGSFPRPLSAAEEKAYLAVPSVQMSCMSGWTTIRESPHIHLSM